MKVLAADTETSRISRSSGLTVDSIRQNGLLIFFTTRTPTSIMTRISLTGFEDVLVVCSSKS